MQKTCGHCGFVNAQHLSASVCPKCLRAYRASAAPASGGTKTIAAAGSRILRVLGMAVLGLVAFMVLIAWLGEKTIDSAASDRQAAANATKAQQDNLQRAISEGKVVIGMQADHVRAAWGPPTTINTTTYSSGTQEQWIYRWSNSRQQYVYLRNGAVRTIQTIGE